jgi:AmmeMemoRadiSam system protein B
MSFGTLEARHGKVTSRPKVRQLEVHLVSEPGKQGVLVRDPLRLADRSVYLSMALAPLLELCDGTRNEAELRASLAVRAGVQIAASTLEQVLSQLDEALLLDNERFAQAQARALREFRTATLRQPVLAGQSYPADPDALKSALDSYQVQAEEVGWSAGDLTREVRGLISPHIDYDRGGAVYASVWQKAAPAMGEADLAIIFGTDHVGGAKLAFTHQRYATPWGVLPTASSVVDQIAQALGPEAAFGAELHHRTEHSIELAAVWLHYVLGEKECQLVPILCGGFEPFMGDSSPADDAELEAALHVLRDAIQSHHTIVVAAADLAHVGPAFGDLLAVDFFAKARHKSADDRLMASICEGDAEGFLKQIRDEGDQRRICGLPPIYLALRLLGDTAGTITGYAQCPADQQGGSFVSVCGILLE